MLITSNISNDTGYLSYADRVRLVTARNEIFLANKNLQNADKESSKRLEETIRYNKVIEKSIITNLIIILNQSS